MHYRRILLFIFGRGEQIWFDTKISQVFFKEKRAIALIFGFVYCTSMKRFLEWIGLKEKLHGLTHRPPFVSVRDIWWAGLGENVGSEINGKSGRFSRPVIVYKKLSHSFYLVIPTTSVQKSGSWYVPFTFREKKMNACLHQIRVIDHRRLFDKIGQLSPEDMTLVKQGFWSLYK